MQRKPHVRLMRVLVQMVNTVGVEQRRAALESVHFVAFAKKQFG
jgi:hypothetical protein